MKKWDKNGKLSSTFKMNLSLWNWPFYKGKYQKVEFLCNALYWIKVTCITQLKLRQLEKWYVLFIHESFIHLVDECFSIPLPMCAITVALYCSPTNPTMVKFEKGRVFKYLDKPFWSCWVFLGFKKIRTSSYCKCKVLIFQVLNCESVPAVLTL